MSYYFTRSDARALKDAESYAKWIESNMVKENPEYAKAYDEWIEDNAPEADFDLSLGDCDPVVEELEIHTAQQAQQMSANLESMSAVRNFGSHLQDLTGRFSCKKERKEDCKINRPRKCKFSYDEETGEFTTWETRYTPDRGRNHRIRGEINPPRLRQQRYEKLSSLFAYERYMEELDREHDFFQKEMARAM